MAGAADGLDREAGNGHADMAVALLPFRPGLNVVGVVKHNAAQLQRIDMVFVAVLVKAEQHVRLVARAQDFAGADAHLENGRAAGNGGGNRHERHDLLLAAAGQARQEPADGLDAVLRIAGDADDRFVDFRDFRRAARRRQRLSLYHSWNFKVKIYRDAKRAGS